MHNNRITPFIATHPGEMIKDELKDHVDEAQQGDGDVADDVGYRQFQYPAVERVCGH